MCLEAHPLHMRGNMHASKSLTDYHILSNKAAEDEQEIKYRVACLKQRMNSFSLIMIYTTDATTDRRWIDDVYGDTNASADAFQSDQRMLDGSWKSQKQIERPDGFPSVCSPMRNLKPRSTQEEGSILDSTLWKQKALFTVMTSIEWFRGNRIKTFARQTNRFRSHSCLFQPLRFEEQRTNEGKINIFSRALTGIIRFACLWQIDRSWSWWNYEDDDLSLYIMQLPSAIVQTL